MSTLEAQKTFAQKRAPIPNVQDGQVLVKVLYLSLDPAMRGWLNDVRSYIKPVQIGAVMRGDAVGIIVDSRSDKFKKGGYCYACSDSSNLPLSMLASSRRSSEWIIDITLKSTPVTEKLHCPSGCILE
jgi:NADPH-dependent curcumin reductase CurA